MNDMADDQNQMDNVFVDREKELKLLNNEMKEVLGSNGRLVLLKGEAGVGKTAVAKEFIGRCSEQGFNVL